MNQMNTTYFVERPRRLCNLKGAHLLSEEKPYVIVATVELAAIDYESFSEDMVADRQFIEDHAAGCAAGDINRCILVKRKRHSGGILVVPRDGCYVGFAACIE